MTSLRGKHDPDKQWRDDRRAERNRAPADAEFPDKENTIMSDPKMLPDGGQAFPQSLTVGPSGDVYPAYPGMTLRDYFAGQALAGCAASAGHQGLDWPRAAKECWKAADAMLAEKVKPEFPS